MPMTTLHLILKVVWYNKPAFSFADSKAYKH